MQCPVSIIVASARRGPLLRRCLESLEAQSLREFEIVLADDAAPEVARAEDDPVVRRLVDSDRLRVVRTAGREGPSAARNRALDVARGDYVCYLDDDNEAEPERLELQYALARESGAPLVLCGIAQRLPGRLRLRQCRAREFSGDAILLDALPDTNVIFHRKSPGARWPAPKLKNDDWFFFHNLINHFDITTIPNIPRPLVRYSVHEGPRRCQAAWTEAFATEFLAAPGDRYSPRAMEITRLRKLLLEGAAAPLERTRLAAALLRIGGPGEARLVANAIARRTPLLRRLVVR